jgi:alpha-amylase
VTVERDGQVRRDGAARRVHATKTIRVGGDRDEPTLAVDLTVTNLDDEPLTARVAMEWSTVLLGGGGNPAAWQETGGRRATHDARLTAERVEAMSAGNDDLGIRLETRIDPPQDVWIAPIETVSNSDAGFELVYQGSTALIGRVVTLEPGQQLTIAVEQRATVTPARWLRVSTEA